MYTEEEQALLEEWVVSHGIDRCKDGSTIVCLMLKDDYTAFGTWTAPLKPSVSSDGEEGIFFATREALKTVRNYIEQEQPIN